jgi:uncharacterized protein
MDLQLSPVEVRVLGTLIEKEITTPEYYPLTLNALVNACNQKSNREPVMTLSEGEVAGAIESLKEQRLAWQLNLAGQRVSKYEHNLRSLFTFSEPEIALLCVLMLRGPQTPGELRGRTDRMHTFGSLEEVGTVLGNLSGREDGPFVVELPRQAGRKETRFMHLFSGMPDFSALVQEQPSREPVSTADTVRTDRQRIDTLENEVAALRARLDELVAAFEHFRGQLE